jgi:hypothetical protein
VVEQLLLLARRGAGDHLLHYLTSTPHTRIEPSAHSAWRGRHLHPPAPWRHGSVASGGGRGGGRQRSAGGGGKRRAGQRSAVRVQEKVGKERAGGGWRAGGWRGRGRGADVDEEKVSPRPANVEQEFQKRPLISLWLFKLLCSTKMLQCNGSQVNFCREGSQ